MGHVCWRRKNLRKLHDKYLSDSPPTPFHLFFTFDISLFDQKQLKSSNVSSLVKRDMKIFMLIINQEQIPIKRRISKYWSRQMSWNIPTLSIVFWFDRLIPFTAKKGILEGWQYEHLRENIDKILNVVLNLKLSLDFLQYHSSPIEKGSLKQIFGPDSNPSLEEDVWAIC